MPTIHDSSAPFLAGGGVCGALARSVDWSATPLGEPEGWPQSLKTTVSIVLRSRHPMFLWWGAELIQIYNDAYLPSFGAGKHPAAMGQPGRECWQETWPLVWPQIDDVMTRGKSSWNEDHLVPIFRNGRIEEVYWTYGYSPVLAEDGNVGGVLVVCTETTARVLAERRSRTLRIIVEAMASVTDLSALFPAALEALREACQDVPFALLYQEKGKELRLLHAMGLNDPGQVDALVQRDQHRSHGSADKSQGWLLPLAEMPTSQAAPSLFATPFSETSPNGSRGLLVFGLSPRLPFDEPYRNFLVQIANHIGMAHARANAMMIQALADNERNSLLLQAPVATALLKGPQHIFQLANPLYCEIVGRSELVGKTYAEAFPELAGTAVIATLDRVYASGEALCTQEELIAIDRSGNGVLEDCYFKFNLQPLRYGAGDVYGMMAVAVDVTQQVRARQVVERANNEREVLLRDLEAASRAKDEFLAMLGHELRNPLAPITTALQLMKLRGETRTTREQQIIERQVKHLTRLVDDLLDISKITRGKVELRKEFLEIHDVISKAIEMASDLFEQHHHELIVDVPKQGLVLDGDPVRLAQVVANLLTNAARYTNPGGKVQIKAYQEGKHVFIRVSDNGVGISSDLLPQIFDHFVQGRRSPDRAEGGLGIGLTLVRNLVTLHNGRVEAFSEGPDKGSEFVIALPALAPGVTPTRLEALKRAPRPDAKRVLVVDDNNDAADLLTEVLLAEGHEVMVAYNPVRALEIVRSFVPDVAVLDIGLPVMDGYELAARLRADGKMSNCRFIALSGYGQEHDRTRSQAGGFDHHLVKPVDIADITKLITAKS